MLGLETTPTLKVLSFGSLSNGDIYLHDLCKFDGFSGYPKNLFGEWQTQ